ncbi:MAG: hypothetical protein ACFFEV_00750 [Candidatus Thorarchaeota archaeon]
MILNSEVTKQNDTNSYLVNGLSITDRDTVEFLDILDNDDKIKAISTAVHFGLLALRDFGAISRMDWIDKRFQSFETEIIKAFDDAKRNLEEYFGERGELQRAFSDVDSPIRSVLDPYTEGSPFWDLRHDLKKDILEVRDVIMKEAGREEESLIGTRKGTKFEKELYDFLQPICSKIGDNIKSIGTKTVGGRKVGDLLIEVNEKHLQKPLKIVIEAKSASTNIGGKDGLLKQLEDSLDARKAHFSIGVVKPQDGLGGVYGSFAYIKPNRILCTFEPDGLAADLAYRFARTEALLQVMGESILDAATCASISAKMVEIRTKLSSLSNTKTHLTSINKSTAEIRSMVEILQADIESILIDIDKLIRSASFSSPTKKIPSKVKKS